MNEPIVPPELPVATTPPRHGCLTAWLIFIIVVSALSAIATPISMSRLAQAGLHPSPLVTIVLVLCALANIGFAIALFRFLKIGFYGFVVTAVIALVANLALGLGIGQAVFGLVGIAILYGVLNIGGPEKAWPRLR